MLKNSLDEAYLFPKLVKEDIEYVFRGEFTPTIIASILDLINDIMTRNISTSNIRSKIYFIIGESLQNINRHYSRFEIKEPNKYSLFSIQRRNSVYSITTGNLISNDEIAPLKNKIDKINKMEYTELRNYSRSTKSKAKLSEKGGAGLGLIEMAKRSGSQLEYDFKQVDNENSYFYLNTKIPMSYEDIPSNEVDYKYSIESIKELHEIIARDNIILFFKGAFNQKSLLSLLSIVESQLQTSVLTTKIYNIMVEMLQNVSKHADNFYEKVDWKPCIFFITESNDSFGLISGNYIRNDKVEKLRQKVEYTNSLSKEALTKEYNSILQNFDIQNRTQGLGLFDLKKKSKGNLNFNFHNIDNKLSFYTIQVTVKKSNKMNALIIEETKETPRIYFDPNNNVFEISNKSLPEDADKFYLPVINWLENYAANPNSNTNFVFKLEYYNTTSARYVSKIVNILNELNKTADVTIQWYFYENDEDMEDNGISFSEMNDVKFELISFQY